MMTTMTRNELRKDTGRLYSDMMNFYKRFAKFHEPGKRDLQRMAMNLDRLNPSSTGERIEAICFLEYMLAVHLGQTDPQHEALRLELLGRAKKFTMRVSRKRQALRKWRREVDDSSEQAV